MHRSPWQALLPLFLFLFAFPANADLAPQRLSGYAQLRYRYEHQYHFNLKNYGDEPAAVTSSDGFWLQRLRVGGNWRLDDKISLAAGIQDARVFDSAVEGKTFFYNKKLDHLNDSYTDEWELYETFLEIKNLPSPHWALKVGRQILSYGDNRVFGPGSWGNSGRYQWDALKLSYRHGEHFIDGIWGAYILHEPRQFSLHHRHNGYGGGFYSHIQLSESQVLEPFYLIKYDRHRRFSGEKGKDDLRCHSVGVHGTGELNELFYAGTLIRQWGNYGRDPIQAWGAHLLAGYHLQAMPWQPTISLEYSFASGDSDPDDGKSQAFLGVFGARDRMYGRMNLLDWSNLHDMQGNLEFRPSQRTKIRIEGHRFWLAEKKDGWSLNRNLYRDTSAASGRRLGDELDIIISWVSPKLRRLHKEKITLTGGASYFRPGEFVKKTAASVTARWFFAQIEYAYLF